MHKKRHWWVGPPTGWWVSWVELRRDVMEASGYTAPMEQVSDATQDTVLRDERATCTAAEKGVDGSVVVEVEVDSGMTAESSKG